MKHLKTLVERLKNDAKFKANFKEDSVREKFIAPLLDKLGFKDKGLNSSLEVQRSKNLTKPTVTGSNSKIKEILTPDYVLYLDKKAHCVLDAKAPSQSIAKASKAESQVFFYAINEDLEAPFYALCNGLEFKLFQTLGKRVILECDLLELFDENNAYFDLLKRYLSKSVNFLNPSFMINKHDEAWYLNKELPSSLEVVRKQAKARHFGCTAYFTRQSWDVVTENIKHFTGFGDVVLDPFGGSGVTAVEAFVNGRQGIHIDLNPLSVFMTKALTVKVDLSELNELSEEILKEFEILRPKTEKEAKELLKKAKYYPNAINEEFGELASLKEQEILWLPKDEILPKGSDVETVLKLFSKKQLAELAILRRLIFKHTSKTKDKLTWDKRKKLRLALMLAFRNTITMCNLTYHTSDYNKANKNAGTCGALAYLRYRMAPKAVLVDTATTFERKIQRIIKGKKELENSPLFYETYFSSLTRVIKDFKNLPLEKRTENLNKTSSMLDRISDDKIFQADATNLKEIESQSIDFIYTDPPYGAKIPYLDLSIMWNAWLDFEVNLDTRKKECIEQGSLKKDREEYKTLMVKSLKEMYRVLKFNRWLALVFQHQDLQLWQILVEEAQKLGFEYVGSVRQGNGQTSFRKRQYSLTVLSGQLIMYFKKVKSPKHLTQAQLGEDILSLALNHIEAVIVKNDGADLETLYGELNINALELGYLHRLAKEYVDLTPFINENFDYDEKSGKYHIKKGQKLRSHHIKVEDRARYFILSYLRSAKRQNKGVSFDDLCLECLPMMQNGVTPSKELIREILEQVGVRYGDKWELKDTNSGLFRAEDLM